MGIHEDLLAISARLDAAVNSALENEVADAVKAKMQDVLDSEVYSYEASDFFMGTRRCENGGLRDTDNMVSKVENGDMLYVENVAPSQSLWGTHYPVDLPSMVEEGWPDYVGKHPFHEDTEKQVVQSGDAEAALRAGLKRQGF